MKPTKSYEEDKSSSDEEAYKCPLKIKHKNKVKKIADLPDRFAKLNSIVKKKYEEFKEGKSTYSMCYLDDENEMIGISDEEDYTVFKDYVKDNSLSTAKVFLNHRGEEHKFDPMIDDAQTVCESMIVDDNPWSVAASRARPSQGGMPVNMSLPEGMPAHVLEDIKTKLDYLVAKDKLMEKGKTKKTKKSPKKKKSKIKSKKEKGVSKKTTNKKNKEIQEKMVKLDPEVQSDNNVLEEVKKAKRGYLEELTNKIKDLPVIDFTPRVPEPSEELLEPKEDPKPEETDEKHEYSIQPFKRESQDKNKPLQENKSEVCSECGKLFSQEVSYICSICDHYYLCEACEATTEHEHVFIKVPAGAVFDPLTFDKF